MSRRLLLASFLSLPLLATGCTEGPDVVVLSDLSLEAEGLDDDGLWYLPDHEGTLTAWSSDADRPTWTFRAEGPLGLAATDTVHGSSGSTVFLRAEAPGAGFLTLLDADDAELEIVPTHVTMPDRILFTRNLDGQTVTVGDQIRIADRDLVTLRVTYAHLTHTLAGRGLVQGDGDNRVAIEHGDRGDTVTLRGDVVPYRVWLTAGPASRFIDVLP